MPVITYCLSELQSVAIPEKGVGELSVESLEQDGIRCFFSRSSNRDQILGPPARESALAFHNVIVSIFRQVAVIHFALIHNGAFILNLRRAGMSRAGAPIGR